jgi:myo-inositol-1(or 4)-monophosphatase
LVELSEELVNLTARLREAVLPSFGLHAARAHVGSAVGGDVTFDIDAVAERVLAEYMAARQPRWAYYSEDRGLQGAADPDLVLVVDPIDGTRPAAAGLEGACVSVAAVPPSNEPTMGDVVAAVIQEIKSGDVFVAEKGAGLRLQSAAGAPIPFRPTPQVDLETLFWTIGFRGRPAVVLATVLEELIDGSSVGGGLFDIGSATFCITRVFTGQLDAYVDIGPAIIAAHPDTEAEFRRVGRGAVLNNSPYDLAAAYLLCMEAGLPVSDAAGLPLAGKRLLGSGHDYQMDSIVAGNDELQRRLVEAVQRGIASYRPRAARVEGRRS